MTTTTGLHVDSLTATDASAPRRADHLRRGRNGGDDRDKRVLTPSLPIRLAVDDLMLVVGYNKGDHVSNTLPIGWTLDQRLHVHRRQDRTIVHRFYQAGDVAPVVAVTSTPSVHRSGGGFRGVDKTATVEVVGTRSHGRRAGTTIGPITGITPAACGEAVVVVARLSQTTGPRSRPSPARR